MGAVDSWRMSVEELDRSSTIRGEANSIGAMVIRASKGNQTPTFISKGKESRIIDLFGNPSTSYPDVWEAIQYNKQDGIWISAPYDATAKLGGVLVSDSGSAGLSTGIDPDAWPTFTFADDTEYFVITAISPYADDLGVKITRNSASGYFTIALYKKNTSGTFVLKYEKEVSLTVGEKDGFGKFMYIGDVFEDDDYIKVIVNATADVATNGFTSDATVVAFDKGARGSAITTTEINAGWTEFQSSATYPADIFMDVTSDDGVPASFDTLRSTYQKYKSFLISLPMGENASTAITTKDGYSINNRGLSFYWNHAKVKDNISGQTFWTSQIGKIGTKFAQMDNIFNGGAPAWIDENGHGGQLGPGAIEMEYDPSESDLELLDTNGINPVVIYPGYGVMITSQKTGQSPNNLSDTSWIAHSRLFDYIISNTLKGVLTFQIVKLNDTIHRQMAFSKGFTLMEPILGANLLSDYKIICDLSNNDDVAMAARQFIYSLIVKVTPYAEEIVLKFVSVGQSVELDSVVS